MCRQRKRTHPPKESHNITTIESVFFVPVEQWGVRGVRGAKMDQIPKFVLNNARGQGVRRAEMDQIPKFVLNNARGQGVRRPEWRGPEKSGK